MSILLRRGCISSALSSGPSILTANTANLNGSSQYFTCGQDSSLNLGDGDKSHLIWFKTSSGSTSRIVSQGVQNSTDYYDIYILGDGQIFARADQHAPAANREYKTNATGFNDGAWHSLVILWNSYGTYGMYVDAVSEAVTQSVGGSPTNLSTPGADLTIGSRAGGSLFNGELGFAGMWDTTLTSGQITALDNSGVSLCYDELENKSSGITTNLTSYWHLADFTGHTTDELTDQHGSNNATNVGSTPFNGTGLTVEC